MKKAFATVVLFILFAIHTIAQQNIGIGTPTPHASAVLDISSTNKGVLVPRMSSTQRNAILSPAKGLMVYDTTSSGFWLYNGTVWDELQNTSSNPWQKNGNNISNGNTGNVGIGTNTPIVKMEVNSTLQNVARFSGVNDMWITLAEGAINRGYIGSYTGSPEDVDFGTYGDNITGKVHLTTGNFPRLTVTPGGNVGIGNPNPAQSLDVNGAIKIRNANAAPSAGTIRFNPANNDFEGFDGTRWKSLTASNNPPPLDEPNDDPNSNASDNLGYAVKIWDDFVFVGVPNYKVGTSINQGGVKVFRRNILTNNFEPFQTLTASDGVAGDKFGFSLDATTVKGTCLTTGPYKTDYVVVGAPNKNSNRGGIYLYRFDWASNQFISVTNNFSSSDGTANDNYGYAVSILYSDLTYYILVGAPLKTINGFFAQGRAYVDKFTYNFGVGCTSSFVTGFAEVYILNMKTNAANSYFGSSLATGWELTNGGSSTDFLFAVGASFRTMNGNASQGVVYMFRYGTLQQAGLYDSLAVANDGNALDYFGNAISIEDSTGIVAVAAYSKEIGANVNQGAVYLFQDTLNAVGRRWWTQIDKFTSPDGVAGDHFGSGMDWQGELLMVGSSNRDDGVSDAGAVYVYKRIPYQTFGFHFQKKITDILPQAGALMGKSISQNTTKYVFGIPDWDVPGKADAGKIIIGDIFY
jgi:FG-GAP repeat